MRAIDLVAVPPDLEVAVSEELLTSDALGVELHEVAVRVRTVDAVVGRGRITVTDDGDAVRVVDRSVVLSLTGYGDVELVEFDFPPRFGFRQGTQSIAGAGYAQPGNTITLHFKERHLLATYDDIERQTTWRRSA